MLERPANAIESRLRRTDARTTSVEGTSAEGLDFETIEGDAFLHGVSFSDVEQGYIGDCWLLGGLMAIARSRPDLIKNMIRSAGGPGLWAVTFHFPTLSGAFEKEIVVVDATVPVAAPGRPNFARTGGDLDGAKRELWVLLIEKAYAKTQGKYANVAGIAGGTRDHGAMEIVTGKRNGRIDPGGNPDRLLNELDLAFRFARKAVTLGTIKGGHPNASVAREYKPEIICNHTYALNGVDKNGRTVDLLNPHGRNHVDFVPIDVVQKVVDEIYTNG